MQLHEPVFDELVLLICLQSDEMQGEAVSDDDFQNESGFTRTATSHGAERQRVQRGKAKVCVTADGSANPSESEIYHLFLMFSCHSMQ